MATSPCAHQQAEPVILTTGERVACVCIECYAQLDRSYIEWQRKHAEIVAHCKHPQMVDLPELGKRPSEWQAICNECGQLGPSTRFTAPTRAELSIEAGYFDNGDSIGYVNIEQRMRER